MTQPTDRGVVHSTNSFRDKRAERRYPIWTPKSMHIDFSKEKKKKKTKKKKVDTVRECED